MAESFNLLNRDNQRVQITQDGFQSNSAQFVQTDKTIGINIFPAQYRVPSSFLQGHRRLRAAADSTRPEADLLGVNSSDRWELAAFSLHRKLLIYHLTCRGNLAITIPVQTGPVWGCSSVGRSKTSRGRVPRKCIASLQAQSATGRHHQGGQASLLLPEAGRKEARKGSTGAQAQQEKSTQRTRLGSMGCHAKWWPISLFCMEIRQTIVKQ